jgi:hypothetical protein
MDQSLYSAQKLAAGFTHLVTSIGLGWWTYISNQQISEEWIALAVAEAKEEWRQRRFRSWQNRQLRRHH